MDGIVERGRVGERGLWRRSAWVLPGLVVACLIQRPPVPPEFLDLRYEVSDSTAAVTEALLRGDTAAQQILRERLPDYARETHVDSLVERIEAEPALAPVALAVRRVLETSIERASGRVRGAVPHPDAQRRLVEAVILGLGMGLQRLGDRC